MNYNQARVTVLSIIAVVLCGNLGEGHGQWHREGKTGAYL